MSRRLGVIAFAAVLLVPDWATAFGWQYPCYPPPPVYYCWPQPQIILVPVCPQPVAVSPTTELPPPKVHVVPREAPKGNTQAPAEKGTDPGVRPADFATPSPARPELVKPPVVEKPAPKPVEEEPGSKVPKQNLPMSGQTPVEPKLNLPAPGQPPAEPKLTLPAPVPSAGEPKLTLPAPVPSAGEPKLELPPFKPSTKPETPKAETSLPPIVLPQLSPIAPTGGVSESKFRPTASDRPTVEVLTVDGPPPAGVTRKVGFYNYTGRDLDLRIEGKEVSLPARSYVTAEVPATFSWRVGTGEPETTAIPAASEGVEIVLK